mgnify:FL=1
MNAKLWQAAAAAITATLVVITAFGFVTPSSRAERQERASDEVRSGIKEHDRRITTLEANYGSLRDEMRQGTARIDGKLDKLIDMQLRAVRRGQ